MQDPGRTQPLNLSPTASAEWGEQVRVLVWAADAERAARMASMVEGAGRLVEVSLDDEALIRVASRGGADLLVAEDAPALVAQAAFLRLPLLLLRSPARHGLADDRLARRAYAVVARVSDLGLAVERFLEHRLLSQRAAQRHEPPRRCSRCGRGYDAVAGRKGVARRFVRFGSVSLCGGCVETLRKLLATTDAGFVEAEAPPLARRSALT